MDLSAYPKDYYVSSMAFTQRTYQDVYPSVDPMNPALNLAGKVAVITGASRGMGAAVRDLSQTIIRGIHC
jgi:hypothetical protein